jgi:pentose-5-phosphate-3-epimerase
MMVSNPDQWIDVFADAGAGLIPTSQPNVHKVW